MTAIVAFVILLVGFIAALATLDHYVSSGRFREVRSKLREVLSKHRPGLLFKYRIRWSMDDINQAIAAADDQVAVLQTWIPTLNADVQYWQESGNKVTFRILLASDTIVSARLESFSSRKLLFESSVPAIRSKG